MSEISEFNESVKYLKRQKASEGIKSVLNIAGKMLPKGLHDPNKKAKNIHLYVPGKKGTTKLW